MPAKRRSPNRPTILDPALVAEYGIDVPTGRLFLTGDVSEAMYQRATTGLAVLNQMARCERLTICLNTLGGDVYQALAIYDLIRSNQIPVDVLIVGSCLSAGVIILQGGQRRAATPSSFLMIHDGTEEVAGEVKTVRRTIKHLDHVNEIIQNIICERVNASSDEVSRWHNRDRYFGAKEALRLGLIDWITP
jgi:ATP-dependent Clp protease protease subunit